jgi:hypothetical protein
MAEKRILPLPPYLRFLLDVPSVANAEITSQETLMALDKDKDKKDKKKVPGNKDQGPETPSEPPEDPREPMTGLPYDILGELFDIAKDVSKMSSDDEEKTKTLEVGVEVEDRKPVTITYTADGKAVTNLDLLEEVKKIPTNQLLTMRREYMQAFNDPTSMYSPETLKKALNIDMPQFLTKREFMNNKSLTPGVLKTMKAYGTLEAINEELESRNTPQVSGEQEELVDLFELRKDNEDYRDLRNRLRGAEYQLKYFESRNMDQEADELRKEINEFKIKNNI